MRRISILIFRSESFAAAGAAEAADTGKTLVVKNDDVQFYILLQRRNDLLGHHEIGAVAHQNIDVASRIGHLDSKAAGDFVAHAGVTVLHVVILGIAGAPKFVQIAGKAARGIDDDIAAAQGSVQEADYFSLAERRAMAAGVDSIDFVLPLGAEAADPACVILRHAIRRQSAAQFLESDASVGRDRERSLLIGIEFGDVNIDHPHVRILKCGLGSCGEIAVPRANRDDQVGMGCQTICGQSSGHSDGTSRLRVIEVKASFPGMRFAHGNSGAGRKLGESFGGLGVDDAAARNDERSLRGPNPIRGFCKEGDIGSSAGDDPGALLEELFGKVVGFGLHILGQRQGDSAGLCGRGQHTHRLGQSCQNLFGTLDTIPVARNWTEAIVD